MTHQFSMAGLDPATQLLSVREPMNSAAIASLRSADALRLGGRLKSGHGESVMVSRT